MGQVTTAIADAIRRGVAAGTTGMVTGGGTTGKGRGGTGGVVGGVTGGVGGGGKGKSSELAEARAKLNADLQEATAQGNITKQGRSIFIILGASHSLIRKPEGCYTCHESEDEITAFCIYRGKINETN